MFEGKAVDWGDRKEAYMLFKGLDKHKRIWFLKWCCRQVSKEGVETRLTSTTGDTNELWWDLMTLCYTHGLEIQTVGEKLIELRR